MMGWGSCFPLLWGLVGRAGLPWALVRMGLGPRPGRFGVTGVPMGVSGGAGSRGGGIFAPSDAFLPIPKASLLPLHHTNTQVGFWGAGASLGCGEGRWYSSVSSWPPASQLHITA